LLITATSVLVEAQDTNSVRFFGSMLEVAAEKTAIAVNCVEVPVLMVALAGVISREATLTVTLAVIDGWALSVAVITAIPSLTAKTSPLLLTVATSLSDDCHVTWVQNKTRIPSEKIAVTKSCCAVNMAMYGSAGVMVIDVMLFFFPQPLKPTAATDSSDKMRTKAIVQRFIYNSLSHAPPARAKLRLHARCSLAGKNQAMHNIRYFPRFWQEERRVACPVNRRPLPV
jgi:hypothetical protein